MKKSIRFSIFVLLGLCAIESCTKTDTTPSSSGDDRAKFLGTWNVNESYQKINYDVTIIADPNESSRVLIDKFAGQPTGNRATAVISGNSITLDANQNVGGATNVSGNGSMSGTTKINWTYTFLQGGDAFSATATYTKK